MRRLLVLALPALLAACSVDRAGLGGGDDASTDFSIDETAHDFGPDVPMPPDLGMDADADFDGGLDAGDATTDMPDGGTDLGPDMPDLGPCGAGCVAPMICCGTTCVDPRSDPSHCGGCAACPAVTNATATCATSTCGFTCNAGFDDCTAAPGCESDLSSTATCGSCATACTAGVHQTATCGASGCTAVCDAGFADCDATPGCETDITSSATSCGRCGNACGFGRTCASSACSTGWLATGTTGAPGARQDHTAVWTGTRMIVWGGADGGGELDTGGVYDPATDTWTATTTSGAPGARRGHIAVWTGTEMIVWGGYRGGPGFLNDGGAYDPATNTWRTLSATGAPSARSRIPSVWSGSAMLVWGGWNGTAAEVVGDGARYAPDTWTAMSGTGAPSARRWQSAVWTGSAMVVFSGESATGAAPADGGRYDPALDAWTPMSTTAAPSGRARAVYVWTGSDMIVWGGDGGDGAGIFGNALRSSGGVYDVAGDAWTATSASPLAGRSRAAAVWTGSEMLVWGGRGPDSGGFPATASFFADGAGYDPAGDAWTMMSATGAPVARWGHTAVWTGSEMILWGGSSTAGFGGALASGARYAP